MSNKMITLIIIVLIFLFLIYKYANRNFTYWKQKKVVYKEPVPFLGSYAKVFNQKEGLPIAAQKIYNEYPNEKMVGAFFGNQPTLLIRDPETIKLVVAKDFYYFNSRGFDFDWKKEPLEANVLAISGDYWRVLRHNLTPLFSSAKMKNMFPLVVRAGQEFEQMVRKRQDQCDIIEFKDLMSRLTMDVIGSCVFGLQMNSISEEETTFRKRGAKILENDSIRSIKAMMRLLFPSLYYFLNLRELDVKVEHFFINLVQNVMKMREGKPVERHDFIDLLTELKTQGCIKGDSIESMKGGERKSVELAVDDKLLAAQSFIFFGAGYESSATTMSYALYELANNKDIQTRLQTEIDQLLNEHDGQITYDMLQEANYLDMVVSETLRKYPVLGVIERQCTSKYTFPGTNVTVDPGIRIHLPIYAIHHDPKYYPQPDLFDPERFSPDVKKCRNQYTYLPFGEGHRICIGLRFGKMQVMVGLITLLKSHSVEPCAKTEPKIEFEPKALITTAKNGIWLKLTSRKKSE